MPAVNIGPNERSKRVIVGVVALGAASALYAWLVSTDNTRWYRAGLVLPLFVAMLGFSQAQQKT